MIKVTLVSSLLIAVFSTGSFAKITGHRYLSGHHHKYTHAGFLKHAKNGQRVDYGTVGLHHGTATGGPVGGDSTQP